jgi:hypothetical protein
MKFNFCILFTRNLSEAKNRQDVLTDLKILLLYMKVYNPSFLATPAHSRKTSLRPVKFTLCVLKEMQKSKIKKCNHGHLANVMDTRGRWIKNKAKCQCQFHYT